MIGTGYAPLLLVSQRFLEVLREHRFTGWKTFPVRITLSGEDQLRGYEGFAVSGRCGSIDDNLSERVILPPPIPTGRAATALRGLCFPPETWNGNDVFTPQDMSFIFVVEPVKQALEDAGITNVAFKRLSEMERIWRADGSIVE